MENMPKISETEWIVMKVLWEESPCTANYVFEKLSAQVKWSPITVKTLLGRLVKKKAVGFEKDGRIYKYYPLVSEDACIKAENSSFLKRVYGGSLNLMLATFLKDNNLSSQEIDELEKILNGKKTDT